MRNPVTTRDDVERAIWFLTQWHGAAGAVDRLLTVVDEYALAHGAVLPHMNYTDENKGKRVVATEAKRPSAFDAKLREDKRLRCNRCGKFYSLDKMCTDVRRTDGVEPACKVCKEQGIPIKDEFRGQRVYRLRTLGGWEESRRIRAAL